MYLRASKPINLDGIASTNDAYENVFASRLARKRRESATSERAAAISTSLKYLAVACAGWAVIAGYLLVREKDADLQKFDPFEILGISASATELEIKKAYKKLSLVYHPDRWVNKDTSEKALAETKFIMVAKSYEALTDPIARENFQKYGNPDGRQALEMSIGLPSWLLENENQGWVIASYLLLSIIVFPASVMLLTSNAAKTGALPKRIYPDTEEIFRAAIRNDLNTFMAMVEIFSLAAEFRTLVYRSEAEREMVHDLRQLLINDDILFPKPSKQVANLTKQAPMLQSSEGNEKALVLILAHMRRLHAKMNEELLDDLEYILSRSPILLRAMVNHARVTCNVQVLTVAIVLQQHINQAIFPVESLLQLPHVPNEIVEFQSKEVASKMKFDQKKNSFMRDIVEKRPVLFEGNIEHQADVELVLCRIPTKKVEIKIGTLREERIKGDKAKTARDKEFVFEKESGKGDLIHVIVDILNNNKYWTPMKNVSGVNTAHTPFMPIDIKEEWYVAVFGGPNPKGFNNIVSGDSKVAAFAIVEDDGEKRLCADMSFMTNNNPNDWIGSADWPVGKNNLFIRLFSNAYVDIDIGVLTQFELVDSSKIPKFKYHEEDENLDSMPGSLYEMLQPQTEQEIDSDFEDEKTDRASDADSEDEAEDVN